MLGRKKAATTMMSDSETPDIQLTHTIDDYEPTFRNGGPCRHAMAHRVCNSDGEDVRGSMAFWLSPDKYAKMHGGMFADKWDMLACTHQNEATPPETVEKVYRELPLDNDAPLDECVHIVSCALQELSPPELVNPNPDYDACVTDRN